MKMGFQSPNGPLPVEPQGSGTRAARRTQPLQPRPKAAMQLGSPGGFWVWGFRGSLGV